MSDSEDSVESQSDIDSLEEPESDPESDPEEELEFTPFNNAMTPKPKEIVTIRGDQRKTSNRLQDTELTRVIGLRCTHLEIGGAKPFVDTTNCKNSKEIALKEIIEGRCPYKIHRIVSETSTHIYREEWSVNELEVNLTNNNIYLESRVVAEFLGNVNTDEKPVGKQVKRPVDSKQGGDELITEDFSLPQTTVPPIAYWCNPISKSKYMYVIPELQAHKKHLNNTKNKIDPIFAVRSEEKQYTMVTDVIRIYEDLRGGKKLKEQYNAEVVTNAWLKMAEICFRIREKMPEYFTAEKTFTSFHVAEAPGNFILALNHFIRTEYPEIEWTWWANSYRDKEGSNRFFGDKYGLIKRYVKRWLLGPEGNGDITSVANIREFSKTVGKVDLVTSDVKFIPPGGPIFDDEENVNFPVHLGHTLISLMCLKKGGVAVLKELTYFETTTVNLKHLLAYCFESIEVFKPLTSRPANSEVYIMCYGFRDNLHPFYIQTLCNWLDENRQKFTVEPKPGLFLQSDIPDNFLKRFKTIVARLTESQVNEINRNLELYEKYKHSTYEQVLADMRAVRAEAMEKWFALNPLKVLDKQHQMLDDHNRQTNSHHKK